MSEVNLNWSGKEEYDAILCCPPGGGRGFVHRIGMGASLMASLSEAKNYGNDLSKAAIEMDKEGWQFIPIKMQVAGILRSSSLSIAVTEEGGNKT